MDMIKQLIHGFHGNQIITKQKKGKEKDIYLNRRELPEVEHISSFRHPINGSPNLPTNPRVPNTRPYLSPIAITFHAFLQPTIVVLQVILQVSAVQCLPPGTLGCDSICKDDKANEDQEYEEHDNEVEAHEEAVPVTGSDQTG